MKKDEERAMQRDEKKAGPELPEDAQADTLTIDRAKLLDNRPEIAKLAASLLRTGGPGAKWETLAFYLAMELHTKTLRTAYLDRQLDPEEVLLLQGYASRGSGLQKKVAQAYLMANDKRPIMEIAFKVRTPPATVDHWLDRFSEVELEMVTGKHEIVYNILSKPPAFFGIKQNYWRVADVVKVHRRLYPGTLTERAVVRAVEAKGMKWRDARKPQAQETASDAGPGGESSQQAEAGAAAE